ncbi:hypothetical protein Fcan01_22735 [Folsomia candida]|uniref:Uncharacterized protein n=1 Tax=Folsomia candida TaxID=158441 RepID=A0A226DB05_FOLCA|nr:hypothetical protein Fcan01_22735 [Folsomia candida]
MIAKFDPNKGLGFLNYPKFYSISGNIDAINIIPHGQKYDGLFYSTFVNKSELVSDIMLPKPFDIYVWVAFLCSGIVLSVALWQLLEKRWSQLDLILLWIFAFAVGQTNETLENQVTKRVKVGSVIIAIWAGMMIILMHSYAGLFYSLLFSEVKVDLPDNLGELLNISGIKLYTFHNPTIEGFSISVDDLFDKVPQLKGGWRQVEKIQAILGKGIFLDTILALAFQGFVRSTRVSGKFIIFQNSDCLREIARLMKETGRFVELRNTDSYLVDSRWAWVSSRDRVGHVFGNFLAGLHEFGIYSYWINR